MKLSLLALGLLSAVLTTVQGQTCSNVGADCTSSVDCAVGGGGTQCRCSWLSCTDLGEETCGGSCLSDDQCSQWSGGDETCVCTWWFECERESLRSQPGYETYAKMMMAIKKEKIQKRLSLITKHFKGQEDLMDERLRHF